ncbi:MAG: hypothetical protein R6V73_04630 [Anaerolineales bacterium]|jgi:hypothetical protein
MTITTIPFELNRQSGTLEVNYDANRSLTCTGYFFYPQVIIA